VPNFGLTQGDKMLKVSTSSTAFKNQTLNIDSITGGEITNHMLYSLPNRERWDSPEIKIIWNDSIALAFETCRFNVWKWNNLEWENLYGNTNKGFCISDYFFLKTSSMVSRVKVFGPANQVYTDSRINHPIGTSLTQKNILKTFALLIALESMKIR
jgi:hypothetical protein